MLFRINAQSEVYEAALADAGVPYVLKGGERFFERPEVREAVLLLRGAAAGGSEPGALVPTVRDVLASTGWVGAPAAAGRRGARPLAVAGRAGRPRRRPGRREPDARPRRLRRRTWPQRADAQHAPTVQGVTLASMHAAKGLEWDAVFVVGLVDGVAADRPVAVPARGAWRRSGGCSTWPSPAPASS